MSNRSNRLDLPFVLSPVEARRHFYGLRSNVASLDQLLLSNPEGDFRNADTATLGIHGLC